MRVVKVLMIVILVVVCVGCFEGKSYITSDKSNKVAEYLSDSPPKNMGVTLNVKLEDKVVLLGYDIDKKKAKAGDTIKITWYWKCLKEPGPGWRLMTHVFDEKGKTRLNADNRGAIREHFQPEHWKPGLVIRDVQKIKIPKGWRHKVFELRAGIWKGQKRIKAEGKLADGGGRVKGPKIATTPSVIKRQVKYIPQAKTAPQIDGIIEGDPAWEAVTTLEPFLDTLTGFEVKGITTVKLLWDEKNLYIGMEAKDSFLQSEYKKHDDPLWKQDAFEIFLDPLGDGKDYYEIQVNPAGIVFDAILPTHRKNQNEWSSLAVVKTTMDGTLNKEGDEDKGWTAEMAIPFASLTPQDGVPPIPGTSWTVNFFRVNAVVDKIVYSAWSPPLKGDFHSLDRFGTAIFADALNRVPRAPVKDSKLSTSADVSVNGEKGVGPISGDAPGK